MGASRTQRDPEIDSISSRVGGLEGRMREIEVGQAEMRAELGSHAQRSQDFRETVKSEFGAVKEQGAQTAALMQDWIKEQRAMQAAEAEHKRAQEAAEAEHRRKTATWTQSLVTPQVIATLLVIVAALAGIQIPVVSELLGISAAPQGERAATGVMSAPLPVPAGEAL